MILAAIFTLKNVVVVLLIGTGLLFLINRKKKDNC